MLNINVAKCFILFFSLLIVSFTSVVSTNTIENVTNISYLDDFAFVNSLDHHSSMPDNMEDCFTKYNIQVIEKNEVEDLGELTVGSSNLMDSPWPMYCHDTHHTGQSPYSTADNPGAEKWRFWTDSYMEDSAVIDLCWCV